VVGTDRSDEAPPGVSAASWLFRGDVAVPRSTLSGLTGLPERSVRRSGLIGSPPPPRRFDDHEDFRRPAVRAIRRSPGSSRRLRLPLRVRASMPSPVHHGPDRPSWGFTPLQRHRQRDPYLPGLPHPAQSVLGVSHPLDGFLSLRPRGLAGSAAAPGVLAFEALSGGEAVDTLPCPLHPSVRVAPQPRSLRSTRLEAPQPRRCLSPSALVPRPWFQDSEAPFGAHASRTVAGAFASAGPLTRLSPSHLGEP